MSSRHLILPAFIGMALIFGTLMIAPLPREPEQERLPMPPHPQAAFLETPAEPLDAPKAPVGIAPADSQSPEPDDQTPTLTVFESVEDYNAVSAYGPLPDYLSDVGFDGGFEVDDQDELIVDQDTRRLFDFFLTTVRRDGMALSSARIEEYITLTLPDPAADKARAVWASYKTYKEQSRNLMGDASQRQAMDPDTRNARIRLLVQEQRELRRQCMTREVVQAFFSEDEAQETQILSLMDTPFLGMKTDDHDS